MTTVAKRGNHRWPINIVRSSREPEEAMLDMLGDIEAWLRRALPHYRSSMRARIKANGIREYTKAVSVLIEEFFADCRDQHIEIPRSALTSQSTIERLIEGRKVV